MEKQGREIKVGENTLYLDEDNILRETFVGKPDEATAKKISEAANTLRNMVGGKVDTLVNIEKIEVVTPKVLESAVAKLTEARVGRVAVFGKNPMALILAAPIIAAARKSDLAYFKTEEEAMKWLKT
ncbi:STAS/SEC14 domain-containing protein [Chloroflexota bacterium]